MIDTEELQVYNLFSSQETISALTAKDHSDQIFITTEENLNNRLMVQNTEQREKHSIGFVKADRPVMYIE